MKEVYLTTEAERRYRKDYYRKNREKKIAYQKQYNADNREQINAKNKEYSMTHDRSEYFRERYRKRKELEKVI